jgi:hypothetical protein
MYNIEEIVPWRYPARSVIRVSDVIASLNAPVRLSGRAH